MQDSSIYIAALLHAGIAPERIPVRTDEDWLRSDEWNAEYTLCEIRSDYELHAWQKKVLEVLMQDYQQPDVEVGSSSSTEASRLLIRENEVERRLDGFYTWLGHKRAGEKLFFPSLPSWVGSGWRGK